MVKFLKHRIGDERVLRLIIRMLNSGIMEDGLVHATEGDVLRSLSKKNDVWFSDLKPVPGMGTDKENHTSWERYYQVSDCSSSSRNDWYSGR
jgi:retron-type reverse transcriptase